MDYFIYLHLKTKVFTNRPFTIEELTEVLRGNYATQFKDCYNVK